MSKFSKVGAKDSMKPSNANLAAQYSSEKGTPTRPKRLLFCRIKPAPLSFMAGRTALIVRMAPKNTTSNIC